MAATLDLTKANRLRLAQAFRHTPRVDLAIPCAIEGQMGAVSVDDVRNPSVYRLVLGPFWYLAGPARSAGGYAMIQELPVDTLLMPSSSEDWFLVAQEVCGPGLMALERYSFVSNELSSEQLRNSLSQSRFHQSIRPIDATLASGFLGEAGHFVDLSAFDSADDFVNRGVGFCLQRGERVAAAAYSSLVCSQGIEISVFVEPGYRERGIATALASQLVLVCLERGLEPHWDAANLESCKLAARLGYRRSGRYTAYYRARE